MRYVWFSLSLLVLLLALGAGNLRLLNAEVSRMQEETALALDAARAQDMDAARARLDALWTLWNARLGYLSMVLPHQKLDALSFTLENARGLAGAQDPALCAELAGQLQILSRSLRLLLEGERLLPGNIL